MKSFQINLVIATNKGICRGTRRFKIIILFIEFIEQLFVQWEKKFIRIIIECY